MIEYVNVCVHARLNAREPLFAVYVFFLLLLFFALVFFFIFFLILYSPCSGVDNAESSGAQLLP